VPRASGVSRKDPRYALRATGGVVLLCRIRTGGKLEAKEKRSKTKEEKKEKSEGEDDDNKGTCLARKKARIAGEMETH
jgi:hypothetical protein